MDSLQLDLDLMQHWFDYTFQLLQRFSMVAMVVFALSRSAELRKTLLDANAKSSAALSVIVIFGAIAIVGTYSGVVINLDKLGEGSGKLVNYHSLQKSEAIVGFRDTITLIAGLIGGPLVGFGTGLIAGIHRNGLGGVAGPASGFATMLLGLFAGYARKFFLRETATIKGVLCVAFIGSVLHRIVLLLLVSSYKNANVLLFWEIVVPVIIINCSGCVLFFWIMSDLDHDRLQNEARAAILTAEEVNIENGRLNLLARTAEYNANFYKTEAELSALYAQVDPHFLGNTLAAIQALIRIAPDNADAYIAKLAVFFNETRESASLTSITLKRELEQVEHYMEFQQLRFQKNVRLTISVPNDLFDYELPPRSLQTLVENALTHGRPGLTHPLVITISGEETANTIILRVQDNGCGIAPERLVLLGTQIVPSSSNGTALYQLKKILLLRFHEQASLEINSQLQQGTTITITLPKEL